MKLIVLYGAPATGKYTVAKSVAERTGFRFFHNHLSIDVAKAILPFGGPGFFALSDRIRLDAFEEAAKQNVSGVVFTFVYTKGTGEKFVQSIIDTVTKNKGEVQFIQLYCDKEELVKRVEGEHRKEMKKINSADELLQILEERDMQSVIPNVESTVVDSTGLTVEETVDKVIAQIK